MEFEIRRMNDLDGIAALAHEARREGYRFIDRLTTEWAEGAQRFEREGEALFGAYQGDRLVGIAGITRQGPQLGRVRRVYVHPGFRRKGIANSLVHAVLGIASAHYDAVVLFTDNPAAADFYETLGFVREDTASPDHATHRFVLGGANDD